MTYHLRYHLHGAIHEQGFDSALSRALFLISWSARIEVIEQWTA